MPDEERDPGRDARNRRVHTPRSDARASDPVTPTIAPAGRNWILLGTDRGGRTAAILYPLTGTCRHHDIDPFARLQEVLRRLPRGQDGAGSFVVPPASSARRRRAST